MFTCGTLTYVLELQFIYLFIFIFIYLFIYLDKNRKLLVKTYTPKSNSWLRPCSHCSLGDRKGSPQPAVKNSPSAVPKGQTLEAFGAWPSLE